MTFGTRLQSELDQFKRYGVYKRHNYLESPQAARVKMQGHGEVVILSSNNYLGLCNEPEVVAAGQRALEQFGAGTGSVRFICGTFTIHRELEAALAQFVGCESSLTYGSCWNANEGLCPTLLGEQDIVISGQLNYASIIESVPLAKAIGQWPNAGYRQKLFSNALPPTVAGSALAAVRHVERHPELVRRLHENAGYFRGQLTALGFKPLPGETPIVPVILGETAQAIQLSDLLLQEGVFVTGFGYPVVPQGHARVRCQLSAAHTREDLDFALQAFKRVGTRLGLI